MVKVSKSSKPIGREKATKSIKKERINSVKNNSALASIFAIVVLIISFYVIPEKSILRQLETGKSLFVIISLLNALIVFTGINYQQNDKLKNTIKSIFFTLLIFSIIISSFQYFIDREAPGLFYSKLLLYQQFLIIITSTTGLMAIYFNRQKLNESMNDLFAGSIPQHQIAGEDDVKWSFKKIFNHIKIGFSKREAIALVLLLTLTTVSLLYRLDYFDLYSDESEVTQGATGYYHSGEFKYWSFTEDKLLDQSENRAELHQFLVALSYKFFGISTWSSRLPSVMMGILFILLAYFISRFFIRDKVISIFIVLSLAAYAEYLLLFRWARMYGVLIPFSMIAAFLGYQFLTGTVNGKQKFFKYPLFIKYLNYNYLYLPFLLVFLYVNLNIHQNSTILLPVLLVFSILSFIIFKDKKYLVVSLVGIVLLIFQFISPWEIDLGWFTFFRMKNAVFYNQFLFGYPFSANVGGILMILGIGLLVFVQNKIFREKLLFLLTIGFTAWLLFSFVIDYPVSFRYVSHIASFTTLIVVGIYLLISKVLFNRLVYFFSLSLLTISILIHFYSNIDRVYQKNMESPAKPSVAWQSIIKNYKNGEIIYRHWGPAYYFDSINPSAVFLELGGYKGIPFSEIYDTLKKHPSGWLTWYTENDWRMDSTLKAYTNVYFKKYNGFGVDSTAVEVFYYNKNMLADTIQFRTDRLLPTANLNLENDYSIAFWMNINEKSTLKPFFIRQDSTEIIGIQLNPFNKKSLECRYFKTNDSVLVNYPADGNWHHVVWYQQGDNLNPEFGIIIDGDTKASSKLTKSAGNLVKFRINPFFDGNMDDLRIYNFVLDQKQIKTIMQNRGQFNSEKLETDGKKFETLYHWQKK